LACYWQGGTSELKTRTHLEKIKRPVGIKQTGRLPPSYTPFEYSLSPRDNHQTKRRKKNKEQKEEKYLSKGNITNVPPS
jgi:hypothetical protein